MAGFLSHAQSVDSARIVNGFKLEHSLIPADQVFSGGPAKDGIPAIDNPKFNTVAEASRLGDDARVLGVDYNGVRKAYPINILNWHEIVNDQFNGEPVVVTFCPLCGSGMVFKSEISGKILTFGVSGLLYNSDVLLYDRQTQTLWSQLMSQGVNGTYKGQRLVSLPVLQTTWLDWKTRHHDTLVLSTHTGYARDYNASPYADYLNSPQTMFPLNAASRRYHPKETVLGLELDGLFKAYPFVELEQSPASFIETLSDEPITIRFDRQHRAASAFDQKGAQLPAVTTFWFAWYAFHPQTEVYFAPKPGAEQQN